MKKYIGMFTALAVAMLIGALFAPVKLPAVATLYDQTVRIVDAGGNVLGGVASAVTGNYTGTVRVVDSNGNVLNNIGGNLPAPATLGNMLFDTGNAWASLAMGGDLNCATSAGSCKLSAQEGIPYSGTALSTTISGQFRRTSASNTMVVSTLTSGVRFSISGTPTSAMIVPAAINTAATFPNNFNSATAASFASCQTGPAESDGYLVKKNGSTVGAVCLATTCTNTGGAPGTGVTFCTGAGCTTACAGGSGSGFTVSPGDNITITAPGTVSGANISIYLVANLS